jgi:hypothetical protein
MRPGLLFAAACGLVFAAGCTVTAKPVVSLDPEVACPGGVSEWHLEIVDQRADRNHTANMEQTLRDSIVRSLPGCRWVAASAPTITLEVHRFSVVKQDNWEAAVEWGVLVRDPQGRTLTEFQADSQISRPNYRGGDNERTALQEALDEAMRRTLTGLRSVSSAR